MPLYLPDSTPPRPPRGDADPATYALWMQMYVVWLQEQMNALRLTNNWLVTQIGVRNLVPDSDIKDPTTYWMVGAGIAVTDGVGFGGGRAFTITGGPTTADAVSSPMVAVPGGDQYVLSGWIDATLMTAGTASWLVRDSGSLATIAEVAQQIGNTSRLEILVDVPAGTLSVDVVFRAVGASGDVIASQPQLELQRDSGHVGQTQPAASLYRANVGKDV